MWHLFAFNGFALKAPLVTLAELRPKYSANPYFISIFATCQAYSIPNTYTHAALRVHAPFDNLSTNPVIMKKSLFLSHILAALFAGIAFTSCTDYTMDGDDTLDLKGSRELVGIHVTGWNNLVTNGMIVGSVDITNGGVTLDIEWDNDSDNSAKVDMRGNALLNLAGRTHDIELTITNAENTVTNGTLKDISKLKVQGTGTIKDAYLCIKTGTEYTLGNGVEKLEGEGRAFLCLDYGTLNLNNNTSLLDIAVRATSEPNDNVISNGTINTYVEMDSNSKLTLQSVTFGENATFSMANGTLLNLGEAGVGLVKFTFTGESATINNGTLWVEEGEEVKLGADLSGTGVLELRGGSLDLDNTSLANETTVTGDASISNGQIKTGVNIDSSCKLTLDGVSIGSDASFIMGDKAQLDLGTAEARLSKFTFGDAATVDNGTLWVGNEDTYTLNTNFAGTYKLELRGGSLDLANTSLAKETTVTGNATVSGGTINASVIINASNALALDGVTIGNNASFTMGNLAQLDLGEASIGLDKFTLEESTATVDNGMLDLGAASYTLGTADAASVIYLGQDHALQLGADAAVSNGRLCLPGGQNAPLDYTLNFRNGMPTQLTSNGVTLNLGENVTFATNHNARFLVTEECIGNPDGPVNISVTADGHFILGDSSRDQTVYGDVNLTHTGDGPAATPGAYDVEMNYRLIGNLTAEMNGRSINIGNIGDDRQDTHPGTTIVTGASDATVGSFTGEALKLIAGGAVTINGTASALVGDAELEGSSVSIGGNLAANQGKNYVKGTAGDIAITGTLNAKDSSTLISAANITVDGDVTGGALTATAGQAIQLKDISIGTKNAELTATGSSITAGNVTAGMLTAGAAGAITMADVKASQTGASIVSSGNNVALNSFSGAGAQIKASQGSVTVASSVSGAAANAKNTFTAAGSVSFNGATGVNNLAHAVINAPQVNWSNGTTLADVTVSHWAPQPAKSPRLLLAAAGTGSAATVNVNGFLTLTENSTVIGNVVINKQDNIIPTVTVTSSTITGQVSGATELVLNSGSVGNVVVDNNSPNDLTVVSFGTSSITGVPFDPDEESYAKLRITALSLNGGKLTVSPKAQDDPDYPDYPDDMENSDEEKARLQVATLMVANNTTVAADLELLPIGENEFSTMIFNLSAANETTACLTLEGDLLSYIPGVDPTPGGKISISLNGNADVEGGKRYALIATNYDDKPEFWNDKNLTLNVSGLAQKPDDLSWDNGTLYFQNGGELTRAVWSPETSHQWNTTDQNWLQDGHRYRYKDGVTVVFDDTGKGGVVELEGDYAPGEVQVNNSEKNAYTFTGSGKITGESTKLIKMGSGTLTIQTANSYGGGTTINEGTLVVAHDEALGAGEVILEGGALKIDNGPKKFRLTVTGQNTRLEGNGHNAFTGTLTMKAGSQLTSSGGALMATQYGIDHIVMENGSTLTMTSDEDSARRIWINNISEFTVYAGTEQDAPKLVDTYLYIDSGFTYTLGDTTGENINSLQNLRGEGSTAFLLDSSRLDLNSKTTKLNIIVDNVLPQGPSTVMGGEIDANVVICERVKPNPFTEPNELEVTNARIGNNASIFLGAGTRLIMSDVAIEAGATFSMGNEAYLDLGGTFAHPSSVSLGAFTFTGANTTIDNGTLLVEKTEDGSPLVLGTNLSGLNTNVSLRQGTSLDLTGRYLAVNKLSLDSTATSATIGNGMVNSAIVVEAGKTLHLGDPLEISGAVTGGGTLVKDTGGIVNITGSMVNFTGNLVVQGGFFNLLNATSLNNMADVTINKGTLGVYKEETPAEKPATANEGTLTITGGHKLTAGRGTTLNANLVMGGGNKTRATLDVHAMAGKGGLQMGSTVTLTPSLVLLSEEDMDGVKALCNADKYDLFYSVDGLSLDGTPNYLAELGSSDSWVKAADVFANDLFKHAEDRYFVFYSGANQEGGAGGNVGTVYIMHVTTLIWNGSAGHMTWGTREDCNWLLGDQSPTYWDYTLDVVFNDTGAGGEVQLVGELEPMSVLVEGTCDYTFTGSGKITGESTKLIKMGSGTLTIENANNYSGVTIIKGGTLALGNDATLGSGTVTLEENGTLKLANGTFANDIQGNGTLVKDNGGTANVTGNMDDFKGSMGNFEGSVVVQSGTLNVMNAPSLDNMADVTINSGSLGVYKGGTTGEANEGTLTITGGHTLTAGIGATLNANLVMGGGGEGFAVLDVHAMAGLGGLQMGSTVTLTPGRVLLSDEDMDAVGALGFMGKYDLFNSVDGLSLDGTSNFLAELGLADNWVKAADVFANDLFKEAEKEYYVFYSGANQEGGAGGNVGTVYIMQMQIPEPTTSTLSLLALAALAARRRKD